VTADERAGVAFVLAWLVAASTVGLDKLEKQLPEF